MSGQVPVLSVHTRARFARRPSQPQPKPQPQPPPQKRWGRSPPTQWNLPAATAATALGPVWRRRLPPATAGPSGCRPRQARYEKVPTARYKVASLRCASTSCTALRALNPGIGSMPVSPEVRRYCIARHPCPDGRVRCLAHPLRSRVSRYRYGYLIPLQHGRPDPRCSASQPASPALLPCPPLRQVRSVLQCCVTIIPPRHSLSLSLSVSLSPSHHPPSSIASHRVHRRIHRDTASCQSAAQFGFEHSPGTPQLMSAAVAPADSCATPSRARLDAFAPPACAPAAEKKNTYTPDRPRPDSGDSSRHSLQPHQQHQFVWPCALDRALFQLRRQLLLTSAPLI